MEDNKIFVPHELKTIEIDVEKKIFRVNGEEFGKDCDHFAIFCSSQNNTPDDEFFKIHMRIGSEIKFGNYDWNGNKTGESEKQVKE